MPSAEDGSDLFHPRETFSLQTHELTSAVVVNIVTAMQEYIEL